ncbi:hypothetical protein GCM10025864_17920 [Luteimicrobium album]|uniref:Uncharacterized protein n=1 Tax=Luteimicrobium album TaxID=1054550 RepID=A0ABQ6I1K3_9MICO|nr:hypothetical protein [Luteimicrobium album]GMA24033.1 hypothetical protein GCM10025864_17920 [Luteimicrobium album]
MTAVVTSRLPLVRRLVLVYLALGLATVVTLVVVSIAAPDDVTPQAWVRGVIVAGTAFLTLRFVQGAIRREHRALLRLRLVLTVLCVAVLAVLAFLPLPGWMIVEQGVCAVVLLVAAVLAWREPDRSVR